MARTSATRSMLGGRCGRIAVEDDGYRTAPARRARPAGTGRPARPRHPPGRGEIRVRLHASSLDDQDARRRERDGADRGRARPYVRRRRRRGRPWVWAWPNPRSAATRSSPGCTPATSTGGSHSTDTPSRPDASTRPRVPPGRTRCSRAPTCSARRCPAGPRFPRRPGLGPPVAADHPALTTRAGCRQDGGGGGRGGGGGQAAGRPGGAGTLRAQGSRGWRRRRRRPPPVPGIRSGAAGRFDRLFRRRLSRPARPRPFRASASDSQ